MINGNDLQTNNLYNEKKDDQIDEDINNRSVNLEVNFENKTDIINDNQMTNRKQPFKKSNSLQHIIVENKVKEFENKKLAESAI